ncbi:MULTISPECIES: response regulator transcription factor [Haloferax]|uniref:Response regulator n=2 Tax=Haloferax TaxID=2251 RepID=A0A6G1Z458_9EURY|nr:MULTISPECIES: response regulator [Haloferax]KAB1188583.1 response regulator transcription factor [Haloferax sp. CBA1149]MRW81283.1 response regulator [Haloferax marinisediminis]
MTHAQSTDALTILLVDDEVALADSLALWLERQFDVRVAYSGREALQAFDEDVDVVFLDRNLPGLPGETVLQELHRQSDPDPPAVVMLSATPRDKLSELPVDAVLTKPVTKTDIFDAVARFTGDTQEVAVE